MTDHPENIEAVKETINRERTNLFTVIAALSFLCICLFVSTISLGAYTISAVNEREAVSIALDDQRLQYYRCIRDEELTADCPQEMVSPTSRDIKRDLEGAGFAGLVYDDSISDEVVPEGPTAGEDPEAFGLLGRVIYR